MSGAHDSQEQWLHDLRNAVNTTMMALAVARRLLETGDQERSLSFLVDAETACDRCRVLLQPFDDPEDVPPSLPEGPPG